MSDKELVIALFDVVGFEDRVRRFSLEEIHAQYRELLTIASSKGSHTFFDARPAGDGTEVPFFGFIEIEQDYFSDTILLWTKFSSATFNPFLHVCSAFVCEALHAKLPLRGAICLGSAIMDKSKREYLGPPLVEAARAEKAQQWIGLSFGRSFDNRGDIPFRADMVRPYSKHCKPGSSDFLVELVLDWPRTWRKEYNESAVAILQSLSLTSKVPDYYNCTIEFVRHSDSNTEWYKPYQEKMRANPS